MKTVLLMTLLLGTTGAFARECKQLTSIGQEVCVDVLKEGNNVMLANFSYDIRASKKVARDLCETFGDAFAEYKIKTTTKRSIYYYETRGYLRGDFVVVLDGWFAGTAFSKIKCTEKL